MNICTKYENKVDRPRYNSEFKLGNKRYNATLNATVAALRDFRSHLKQQKKCCKCREYFGVKNP